MAELDYLGPKAASSNRIATFAELGGGSFGTLGITIADQTLLAGYGLVMPSEFEIGSGFFLELASGAIMEIS
jgi:hypothetical protein